MPNSNTYARRAFSGVAPSTSLTRVQQGRTYTTSRRHISVLRGVIFALCAVVGLLGTTVPAQAQDDDALNPAPEANVRTIGFDEAIQIALDQNTTLKRAANDVELQDAVIWSERMDFAPNLSLRSSATRQFGRSFSQEEGAIINETNDFFNVDASSSITVFDGLSNFASLRQANSNGEAAELSLGRTRQDVVFTVMEQFINLVETREIVRVREEELAAQEQQLRQTQEFVDAGARPVSDLYQQQASVAQIQSDLLTAQREVQLSETRLIQTLQLDPFAYYDFTAPSVEDRELVEENYEYRALLERAYDRRSDLRAQRAATRAAEHGITVARSGYFPTLTAGFDYGSNWVSGAVDPDDPTGPPPTFFDVLDNRRGGSFGLSLSFPVFDRLQTHANVERAQVQAQNERYALDDQRLQISLQVRQAYLDYQTAEQQLDVTEKLVQAAEQAQEAARERYNLGAADIIELTNANRDFIDAASQRIRARYNFIFQKKLIDYYVGTLDPREPLFE